MIGDSIIRSGNGSKLILQSGAGSNAFYIDQYNNVVLDNFIVKWLLTLDLLKDENIKNLKIDNDENYSKLTDEIRDKNSKIAQFVEDLSKQSEKIEKLSAEINQKKELILQLN